MKIRMKTWILVVTCWGVLGCGGSGGADSLGAACTEFCEKRVVCSDDWDEWKLTARQDDDWDDDWDDDDWDDDEQTPLQICVSGCKKSGYGLSVVSCMVPHACDDDDDEIEACIDGDDD